MDHRAKFFILWLSFLLLLLAAGWLLETQVFGQACKPPVCMPELVPYRQLMPYISSTGGGIVGEGPVVAPTALPEPYGSRRETLGTGFAPLYTVHTGSNQGR